MKKLILWMIKIFKLDIPIVEIKEVQKIVEKEVYIPKDFNGIIAGDITVRGNVILRGSLKVTGSLTINNKEV